MKEGTKSWIAFADRDLEAAKSLLELVHDRRMFIASPEDGHKRQD
jgi:hypothetical protein